MNQAKHRKPRHNGAEDRQDKARPPGAPQQPEPRGPLHPPVRSVAVWGPIAAVTVLAFLVTIGVWRRVHERGQEKAFTKQATQLEVNVVTAQRDRKPQELILPGTFQAFKETTIYPRSNGYVKSWKADIGDDVKEGQLLAEIETPEVDQQLAQAKASYEIAKVTADRWRDLVAKKVVSAQENDEKQKAAEAARANLEQLEKTQAFKEIVAPFGGSIPARNIDVGTLATAGTGNAGTPLFRIVQSDPLRVYVYAPQANAPSIREGLAAKILVQEFPGQDFDGRVTRTAGALDPQSRTMQVEVQVPNHEGKLYAGICLSLSHGGAASGHRGQRQPYSLANDSRRARFRHPVGSARRAGGENESRHESNGRFGRGYSSSIDTRRKTKRRRERKAIIFRPV